MLIFQLTGLLSKHYASVNNLSEIATRINHQHLSLLQPYTRLHGFKQKIVRSRPGTYPLILDAPLLPVFGAIKLRGCKKPCRQLLLMGLDPHTV